MNEKNESQIFPHKDSSLQKYPLEEKGQQRGRKNRSLLGLCRYNRKHETAAEAKMWSALRAKKLGVSFRRQQQIGSYIVDFVCFSNKLIVECDGSQHNKFVDAERTRFLEDEGYSVFKFWNNEILKNLDGCVMKIMEGLKQNCHPLQTSPLKGEDSQERMN